MEPMKSGDGTVKSKKNKIKEFEVCLDGWRTLAAMLGCSESKIRRKKAELMRVGVIFEKLKGRPPRKVISFFPSIVKKWAGIMAAHKERV